MLLHWTDCFPRRFRSLNQYPENVWSAASEERLFPLPALFVALTSLAVVLPFCFLGNSSGHDFEFHMLSWMEVVSQWKQGIWLPRWAALAHWGYGEARFLFYPPVSWNFGALLGEVLPWKIVPGVFIWCALTASGCTMFLLVRRWFARNDAIFAAALYAANPYVIVIVYWRSAFAELLTACLLPLLVLCVMRAEQDRARTIVPFALLVAASWLTNVPAAVMLTYSLALFVITVAIVTRNWRGLIYAAAGLGLGTALAAFYLIPVVHEKSWVQIGEVLAPGYRPQDNFLFSRTGDVEHNRFNLLVSSVGTAELIVLAIAGWISRPWRLQQRRDWNLLTTWGVAITVIMLPLTGILWGILPQLQFVQFPWRWLLCLNVPFAFFVTLALRSWNKRAAICAAMLIVLWVVWHQVQPPWWDQAADVQELHDFISDGGGYEGTDEYVPAGADPQAINKNASLVAVAGKGKANVRMLEWSPQFKRFTAEVDRPERLRLKLFNYPAWRVEVNGVPIIAKSQPKTGEILIPLETGISEVRVRLIRTPDRTMGGIVSLVSALLLAGWTAYRYRMPLLARSSKLVARSPQ